MANIVGVATSRRTPDPAARQRDADRTQAALLDAAQVEFAAKGLAGARVSEIAARAGVNKQLISYYFGGKNGLYDAILQRWHAQEQDLARPELALPDVVLGYLHTGIRQRDLQRMFVRECLDEDISQVISEPDAPEIEDLRRRQRDGELADELDPAFVLLALQAIVAAGVVFPRDVKRYLGLEPDSPEYESHAAEQLRRILRRLAP